MPISRNEPSRQMGDLNILFYGKPGIGKSTLASEIPGNVFIATEAGLNQLAVDRWEDGNGNYVVDNWDKLYLAVREVLSSQPQAITIDTLDMVAHLAIQKVCQDSGEDWIGDGKLGFGKGMAKSIDLVRSFVNSLCRQPVTLILTSHSTGVEEDTPAGERYVRQIPSVPDNRKGELLKTITSQMEVIAFLDQVGSERVMRIQPHRTYEAKCRFPDIPPKLPLGWTHFEQAWKGGSN